MLINARSGMSAISDVRDLASIDVVAENVPLCLCQQILPCHKLVEELCDVGGKFPLLQTLIPGPGVEKLRQFIHLRDPGGQALFRQFFLLEPLQTVGNRTDKSPCQEEGQGQQYHQQSQSREDPCPLYFGGVCRITVLGDQDRGGPGGALCFTFGNGDGLVQADIPLGAGVIFVIVSPLVNDKCLLAVQIGAVADGWRASPDRPDRYR